MSVYHRRDRERDLDPVTLVSLLRSLIDCNNGGRTVFKLPDCTLHTRAAEQGLSWSERV